MDFGGYVSFFRRNVVNFGKYVAFFRYNVWTIPNSWNSYLCILLYCIPIYRFSYIMKEIRHNSQKGDDDEAKVDLCGSAD